MAHQGQGADRRFAQRGREVEQFLSTFTNKVDRKGRVSVPAEFRAVLAARQSARLLLFPALYDDALDAAAEDYLATLKARADAMDPDDPATTAFRATTFAQMRALPVDPEGRIVLDETFKLHAQIDDQVTFVGLGDKFQLWNPGRWVAFQQAEFARQRALRNARFGVTP